jgi:hypothetical protein
MFHCLVAAEVTVVSMTMEIVEGPLSDVIE